jgi:hypothetical protein
MSEQQSQSSMHLDFQRISSLRRSSSNEALREVSMEKVVEQGEEFWMLSSLTIMDLIWA